MKRYCIFLLLLFLVPTASAYTLSLTLVDEDTNNLLNSPNPTVTVAGNSCTVTNGTCTYNVGNTASVLVSASLLNYETRNWTFGLDKAVGDVNKTLTLLKSTQGTNIPFTLRNSGGTAYITDGNVTITTPDNNYIAGRFSIGSDSYFIAFLKPNDRDYLLVVETSSGDFNVQKNPILVKSPQDEASLDVISSYSVRLTGIGNKLKSSLSADQNFIIFPYTNDYYVLDIDVTGYIGRDYYFRLNRSDYDQNNIILDYFNGSDGDPPNAEIWTEVLQTGSAGDINILSNDLNVSLFGGANWYIGINSDANAFFSVDDIYNFKFLTHDRPTSSVGTAVIYLGWYPDNNVNFVTANPFIPPTFGIGRSSDGTLELYHNSSVNNQLDGGTGEKTLKVTLERIAGNTYVASYYLDSNKMAEYTETISHHIWKGGIFMKTSDSGTLANSRVESVRMYSDNSYVIQPYLASTSDARQVKVEIFSITRPTVKISDIRVVSNTGIEGSGTEQVQTIVTDSAGSGTMSFIVGKQYTLQLYDSSDNLLTTKSVVIGGTQTVYSIGIEEEPIISTPQLRGITLSVSPSGGTVTAAQVINVLTYFEKDISVSDLNIIVVQNDLNIFSIDGNLTAETTPSAFPDVIENFLSLSQAGVATGQFKVVVNVVTSDGNSSYTYYSYSIGEGVAPERGDMLNDIIRGQIKTDMGCTPGDITEFCWPLMIGSLMLAFLITISVFGALKIMNADLMVIGFIVLMGFAMYFYWFPVQLYAIGVVFGLLSGWSYFRNR